MNGKPPPAAEDSPDTALVGEICSALRQVAGRFGLDLGEEPRSTDAVWQTKTDPFSGENCPRLVWEGKARNGEVNFFPDGRIFAEYQVLLALPGDAERYIEAVQVWGRRGALKSDAVIGRFAG